MHGRLKWPIDDEEEEKKTAIISLRQYTEKVVCQRFIFQAYRSPPVNRSECMQFDNHFCLFTCNLCSKQCCMHISDTENDLHACVCCLFFNFHSNQNQLLSLYRSPGTTISSFYYVIPKWSKAWFAWPRSHHWMRSTQYVRVDCTSCIGSRVAPLSTTNAIDNKSNK